ncbi:MAG: succinate dehydrogenase [Chloroflexota bacterium]
MTVEVVQDPRDPAPRTLPGRANWWIQPVAIAVGFTLFVIYSAWSVLFASGGHSWEAGPYLSPYYSPLLKFTWWPLSSAILVAWIPLAFRGTCYYYRKAYYRAFFWDPPACAIREPKPRLGYTGETRLPWILNNFHRFALYLALIILAVLWYDTINAFHYQNGLYIGIGSVLMLANVILLTGYTFSCHALRHLVGGNVNCFSCVLGGGARHGLWGAVTKINPYHGSFAWASLISVAAVDVYIRVTSAIGTCFGVHTGC